MPQNRDLGRTEPGEDADRNWAAYNFNEILGPNSRKGKTGGILKADHSTHLGRLRIIRGVAAGIAILMPLMPAVADAADCGKGDLRETRKVSLQRTGIAVANAIQARNSAALLRYITYWGVGFGIDKAPLSKEELQRQIKRKKGVYCLLFSTRCIASTDQVIGFRADEELSKWKVSYAEWLSRNNPYLTEVELKDDDGSDVCGGSFRINARAEMTDTPNYIEFTFALNNGRWLFTNTPDY